MMWSQTLSELIVDIYRHSTELPLNEFRTYVFVQTQSVIGFDSGVWSTRSELKRPPCELDTFLYHQPEVMMQNYERVLSKCGITDPFFEQAYLLNGKTQFADAQDLVFNKSLNPLYEEHCKPFGLEHGLSTLFGGNQRGMTHVVSFYRAERSNPFNERDRQHTEWLLPHFIEGFRLNLLHHFRRRATATGFSAICDRLGVIIEAEDGFLRALGLPGEADSGVSQLELNVDQLPADGLVTLNQNTQLKVTHSQGLFYLELLDARSMPELSLRQQQLVNELVKGLPDKLIAKNLNISLKTVRNQLSDIYRKLNVDGRAATIAYLLSGEGLLLPQAPR